jgi:hypothetical protein
VRREITIGGFTETTLFVDSAEFIGLSHGEIIRQLKRMAEGLSGTLTVDDGDVELAAYQIRGDLS